MIFYHGTDERAWKAIQEEGVLWGIHSYRYTYLSPHLEVAEVYAKPVLLEVSYDPVGIDGTETDNYGFDPPPGMTWQFSVFIPIPLSRVRRIDQSQCAAAVLAKGANRDA